MLKVLIAINTLSISVPLSFGLKRNLKGYLCSSIGFAGKLEGSLVPEQTGKPLIHIFKPKERGTEMLKVLIVDDEMFARDELKYLLEQTEEVVAVDEAEHIEEAFDKMADHKPDILFLDIDLSGENGFDIAKRLKKMSAPPAVVFATAYDVVIRHFVKRFFDMFSFIDRNHFFGLL